MDRPATAELARQQIPARKLPGAVRRFLDTEAAGGIALVVAAIVAVAWANSPWSHTYETFWHAKANFEIGTFAIHDDLRHVINDGLMALFFVVVALEVKREIVAGDLRDPKVASLPAVAALGGMLVPAALYFVFNTSGDGASGWGIPMATDIAFALGVLALLGDRCPPSLKLFLLSLAIVDDIGAIVVIAVFYAESIDPTALGLAVVTVGIAGALRWARVWWPPIFVALGVLCWFATYNSGIHATLAGVAFGLLAPARPLAPGDVAKRWSFDLSEEPSAAELRRMTGLAKETVSVAERVQHTLHPLTSFVVVPIFALANAGVQISGDAFSAPGAGVVAAGVVVGLVVGKLVGITGASMLAVRLGLAKLPDGSTWPQVAGISAIAGIGFTVSLFISGLAFDDPDLANAASLAVLVASLIASALGIAILRRATR